MAVDLDLIRRKRKEAQEENARRSAKFFRFSEGRNVIRILPPWEGSDDFSRVFGQHWGLGPEGKTVVYCPKQCFGLPCPICDELDYMRKTAKDDTTKEWVRRVSATPRFYVNIIDLKDPAKGPQVCEIPKTVMEEIWNIMVDDELGVGDITQAKGGYDLFVDKTGTGLLTRYSVKPKRDPSDIDESVLENLVDLDAFVKTLSVEELRAIWEGKTPEALPAPKALGAPETGPPPAPAEPSVPVEPEIVEPSGPSVPGCFGSFNEDDTRCLDCAEQDECEMKMIEERRKARAAAKRKGSKASAVPKISAVPPAGEVSADELMKEMEAAIKR
jgi:hypothetical protein